MPIPTTFKALVKTALTCGYILTRHEDAHLIAIPWTDSAKPAEDLIETLFGESECYAIGEPSKRLHGRKLWTIGLGDDATVSVSVMPRIATEAQREIKRRRQDGRNKDIFNDYVYNNLSRIELSAKYNLSAFHIMGIMDQLRMRKQREDAHANRIRPQLDEHKRRVKNDQGHEAGFVLAYPTKTRGLMVVSKDLAPVMTYREAQREADRLNAVVAGKKQA